MCDCHSNSLYESNIKNPISKHHNYIITIKTVNALFSLTEMHLVYNYSLNGRRLNVEEINRFTVKLSISKIILHERDGLTEAAQLEIPDRSRGRMHGEGKTSPAFWIQIAAIIRTISPGGEKNIRGVWDNVE